MFPDTAPTHDLSFPSPTNSTLTATSAVKDPVVAQPMCTRISLPSRFFVPSCDADFLKWDALYPETTAESIKSRLHHQCTTAEQTQKLMAELMMGKAAMHEYLGSCPPPAAFAPICPPMCADAKPIYIVQHTLSQAAKDTLETVVAGHLKFGIDGPSTAFAQMPIFTKSEPGTSKKRVLFDDSANNSLNMISVGMQLPTPMEREMFLDDAEILFSVDM
ncbi:hypothetical protein H4S07_002441 [Coemansia furcata]|uniref:Uncharacterized protein n=1 Tax=Coemansia furcata TaxID=417177 RepID=A0ACC1LLN2_9FUNG|nr:hypothetical protein H4S07_002441 [Coemansia furcata]